MDTDTMLAAIFMVASFTLAAYAVNKALAYYLVPEEEEAPEEDAVQYTAEFETYWLWTGSKSGVPNIFLSDRVKPVAFAAWQTGRAQLRKEIGNV